MPDHKPHRATRFIAVILALGGIAGVFVGLWTQWQVLQKTGLSSWKLALVGSVIPIMFAFCGWVGVELWTGRPRAYALAKLAVLLQVPQINLAGFSYKFYTALALFLSLKLGSESTLGFNFEGGSELSFYIRSTSDELLIGLNLVAVALLIFLIRAKPKNQVPMPLPPQDTDTP